MKKILVSIGLITFLLYGCEEVFYVKDISKDTIEIIAPSNNVELNSGTQNFSWTALDGADTYQIQIATPNFENALQLVLDSTTTKMTISKDLEVGVYQWRVKAINSAYNTSFTTADFNIKN